MEASSLPKTWAAGRHGRGSRRILSALSRAVVSPPSSLQELIQTKHTLEGIKRNKPTFSFPKMHSIQRPVEFSPSPEFLAAALNFLHMCYFMTVPTGIIDVDLQRCQLKWFYLFISECSKQFCKELEQNLQTMSRAAVGFWQRWHPCQMNRDQGRGWKGQEWHKKMDLLCCWASCRSWEIPHFQIASILHMGRRNTAAQEEIKQQLWWEPGASPGSEHFPQAVCEPWWPKSSTVVTILEQNWSNHTRGEKTWDAETMN